MRHAHLRHQLARHCLVGRQDHIAVALFDHGVVGPGQQGFENRQRLLFVYRLGGGEADRALHALGDAVVLVQQVAHHAVDHGLDGLIGEVEHDVAALLRHVYGCRGLAHKRLIATNELALRRSLGGRWSGFGHRRLKRRALCAGALQGLVQQVVVRVEGVGQRATAAQGNGGSQAKQRSAHINQGRDSRGCEIRGNRLP